LMDLCGGYRKVRVLILGAEKAIVALRVKRMNVKVIFKNGNLA